jgi:hypothetical protein
MCVNNKPKHLIFWNGGSTFNVTIFRSSKCHLAWKIQEKQGYVGFVYLNQVHIS